MEILVFLFVLSNVNLVLADDSAAIETTFLQQNAYKVHPDPEDVPLENDQVAESSHSVSHVYGSVNNDQAQNQNYIRIPAGQTHDGQQTHQYRVQVPETLRHDQQHQGYQPQHIYVQHYPLQPIRILGAEASPLQQTRENENQQSIGFSSYVEHVTPKEEEEINSALKEGSVTDIKRLVPKSGISFKIYHNEKDLNVESQKLELQQNVMTHTQPKIAEAYSKLHHNVKPVPPVAELQIQTAYQQPTSILDDLQQNYLKSHQQQHGFENQHLSNDQQGVNGQQVYYTHQEVQPQKGFWEVNGKSSTPVKSQFNHGKIVSSADINSLSTGQNSKLGLANLGHRQYQKQWNYDSRSESSQKIQTVKPVQVHYDPALTTERTRGIAALHYDPAASTERPRGVTTLQYEPASSTERPRGVATLQYEPVSSTERPRGVATLQYHPVSSTERTRALSYSQISLNTNNNRQRTQIHSKSGINEQSNAYVSRGVQTNIGGYTTNKAYADQKPAPNRFSGYNAENGAQTKTINHLGTSAYGGSQTHKTSQSNYYTNPYSNLEAAKGGHHPLIAQTSQNNFDHQKALEGSTTFDIKNAIDNSGNSIHQTNHPPSTHEIHPLVDIQKQQLAYIIPKIPSAAIVIDDSIHDSPVVEGHQVKHFGHAIALPQHPYHTAPEVGGKFFHQPQAIIWSPEQLKHSLSAGDLHQHVLRLHLPKEEYQYVKAPNVELLPTTSVSHIPYQQQKHPYVLHYDLPVAKYPQDVHYQPKTKTPLQNGQVKQIKISQPNGIDWNWLKNMIPNLNALSLKPEPISQIQEGGKKIVPILIRKRKNRSNNKQEVGVVYGKVNNNRRPVKPNQRQEKSVLVSLRPEASNNVKQYETQGEKKNEFSVSASYKVDRSFKSS